MDQGRVPSLCTCSAVRGVREGFSSSLMAALSPGFAGPALREDSQSSGGCPVPSLAQKQQKIHKWEKNRENSPLVSDQI